MGLLMLVVTLAASASSAGTLDGTIKVGGIFLDQSGDRSAVQETYNVYDDKGRRSLVPTGEPEQHFECDDVLVAGAGSNSTLHGGAGNDRLAGGGGSDFLFTLPIVTES